MSEDNKIVDMADSGKLIKSAFEKAKAKAVGAVVVPIAVGAVVVPIAIGTVVKLKSGGPWMTVETMHIHHQLNGMVFGPATCVWFEDGVFGRDDFYLDALVVNK